MYKVLIVEDEMLVRMGLKATINWNELDMVVIGDVPNGQIAYEVYINEKPDIILTDIKMPVMDGIELITKIREHDEITQIIILSCLEDFNIVRKAMKLGVEDYILKLTMTNDEIIEVLKKVKAKLDKSAKKIDNLHTTTDTNKLALEQLHDYIVYHSYSVSTIINLLNEANLRVRPDYIILCILEIDHYEKLEYMYQDERGGLIRFSILNILNEILDSYNLGVVLPDTKKQYLLVLSFKNQTNDNILYIEKILEHIQKTFETYMSIPISITVSPMGNGYEQLPDKFNKCILAQKYKFIFGLGKITYIENINLKEISNIQAEKLKRFAEINHDFIRSIQSEILKLARSSEISEKKIKRAFTKWSTDYVNTRYTFTEGLYEKLDECNNSYLACESLDEVISCFKNLLVDNDISNDCKNGSNKEIDFVIDYINKHYSEPISVQQIATMINYSPNYLSMIFKKVYCTSLINYINKVRLENAKKLLKTTNLHQYEIAQKVGFTNESYFSYLFKKKMDVTPNDFRIT
jgi:two-component system response regulator YesN